jgi:hypothetical protein
MEKSLQKLEARNLDLCGLLVYLCLCHMDLKLNMKKKLTPIENRSTCLQIFESHGQTLSLVFLGAQVPGPQIQDVEEIEQHHVFW